ncbi:CU044_5270 family protein [Actinocatenispora sera]|uniref:Uncharacterized protein n=1 Tax=Actinocatenispora sera TaxID=390989 RepID=A0A810LD58_9ACTN|nr:CU044_5270 family protein [Actinocatenispora sera]BCJ32482.1 hypothetical protein Asera_65900 [Actinocatenispora sera]
MSDPRLQELFDAPDTTDEPPMSAGFAQSTLERGRRRTRRRRATQAVATGGVAAVAALAVGGAVVLGGGAAPDGARPPAAAGTHSASTGQPATATELLNRASLAAYHQNRTIRPDQFIYQKTTVKLREPAPDVDGAQLHGDVESNLRGVRTVQRSGTDESWLSVDGSKQGWATGSLKGGPGVATTRIEHPTLDEPTYQYLTTLPTDPDALMRKIDAAAQQRADQKPGQQKRLNVMRFEVIENVLNVGIVPPELARPLYTDLGRLSGVELVRDATDAAGRKGVGVAITDPDSQIRYTIIFDRHDYRFLGFKTDDPATGKYLTWTAVLAVDVVDHVK